MVYKKEEEGSFSMTFKKSFKIENYFLFHYTQVYEVSLQCMFHYDININNL